MNALTKKDQAQTDSVELKTLDSDGIAHYDKMFSLTFSLAEYAECRLTGAFESMFTHLCSEFPRRNQETAAKEMEYVVAALAISVVVRRLCQQHFAEMILRLLRVKQRAYSNETLAEMLSMHIKSLLKAQRRQRRQSTANAADKTPLASREQQ